MPTRAGANKRSTRKRLLVAAGTCAAMGAIVTVVAGVTFGLFSATAATQRNEFGAGTVTLTSDTSGACSVSKILPGDAPSPCTLSVTYSGSLPAYLGLDILIQTQAGSGGLKLYDPAGTASALQVTVTDNQATPISYEVPTVATTCPATAPAGSTCYQLNSELVSTNSVASGTAITFFTHVALPLESGNGYQGGSAQIIQTVHAVQATNNGSTATCVAGRTCTSVSWS